LVDRLIDIRQQDTVEVCQLIVIRGIRQRSATFTEQVDVTSHYEMVFSGPFYMLVQ